MRLGDIIVSGSGSAYQVFSGPHRDARWKTSGLTCLRLFTQFGDGFGMTYFVPDYLLSGYRVVEPGRVYPVPGGAERWDFVNDTPNMPRRLVRTYIPTTPLHQEVS